MAESAQRAQHEAQLLPIRSEAKNFTMATFAVAFFPWLLGIITLMLVLVGRDVAAALTGIVTVGSAGPSIIQSTRRNWGRPATPPSPQPDAKADK